MGNFYEEVKKSLEYSGNFPLYASRGKVSENKVFRQHIILLAIDMAVGEVVRMAVGMVFRRVITLIVVSKCQLYHLAL